MEIIYDGDEKIEIACSYDTIEEALAALKSDE